MSRRLLLAAVVLAALALFVVLDLGRYADLAFLQRHQTALAAQVAEHRYAALAGYCLLYVAVAALSLPGATVLTLAGGALFGFWAGLIAVSFAATLGATLAMLVARFLLRDAVVARFGARLAAIDAGIARDGPLYLFALRLVPAFPFFVINLLLGLTRMRATTFAWVSQLGMLPATAVYVNVGTQLAQVHTLAGIVSPTLLVSFALLGLLPLLARRGVDALRARRVYAPWARRRPARCDYNLVVIGAGSAGLVTSYIAAATRAKVALVERHRMGGDCLHTGCVPSKALIRSARLLAQIARSHAFGIEATGVRADFAAVMARVQAVVQAIAPHDSVARYTALGVECIAGTARILTPWTVEVQTAAGPRLLTTRSIVVATGARPLVPPIPGLAEVGGLTSDTVWSLREQPRRLLVLGGGPIGCELAQAFARLGSQVTLVERLPRLMIREDREVGEFVRQRFAAEGIRVLTGHTAQRFAVVDGERRLTAEATRPDGGSETVTIAFDAVLVAVGRVANTGGLGLEALGIATTAQGTVATDEALRTIYPNILACGDVAGPYQFTHAAAHQAWHAAVNALFGTFRRFKVDYHALPWVTFTDPEVARVGLNEQEAAERGIAVTVTRYGIDDLDRAIAEGAAHGFVKVLTAPGTDRILGVTLVGEQAGESIGEFVLAMRHGLGLAKILATVHAYPTLAEANKYVAGTWKRSTVTQGQWTFLAALQAWRRGAAGLGSVVGALGALRRDRRPAYPPESDPAEPAAAPAGPSGPVAGDR